LYLRMWRFAWFQKFSIPLMWFCLSANSFELSDVSAHGAD